MGRLAFAILATFALLTAAPTCQPVVGPVGPTIDLDASTEPSGCIVSSGVCCRSCAVLARFGCVEAKPTAGGKTCENVCIGAANIGTILPDVSTCDDVACVRAAGLCK